MPWFDQLSRHGRAVVHRDNPASRPKWAQHTEVSMRVLVVEDEAALADAVARGLRRHGMSVDVAYDGEDGYGKATSLGYDVLVLDRDLPGRSGDEICRSLTAGGPPPLVMMMTASASAADKAAGFSLGASDYVTTPFGFADLVQRVLALGKAS
jgi:DNA-binding response OmpR family regulator